MTASPASSPCCDEFTRLSRRGLISGAIALAGTATAIGSAVVTASPAQAAPATSVLVVLSMRGAADGMSLVVPHADPVYYSARPRIAVPAGQLLAKDDMFGLHPKLAPLMPLWSSGRLAAVQATGLPVPNRSHFAAMEEVEDANPGSTTRQGWLNRLVGTHGSGSPLQALNVGAGVVPTSLFGPNAVMSAGDLDSVGIPGADEHDKNGGRKRSLHTLWDGDTSPLGRAMTSTFTAVDDFSPVLRTADRAASYPRSDLGRAMAQAARVIRGDVGVEVVTVDQGDWDMHSDLGTLDWGQMQYNAQDLAGSIAAFFDDLGQHASKVTLVALSEFGRRVQENSSTGLDHGYGNAMLLAGAGVKGGKYYGTWPGLSTGVDADLTVTTDYRSVLSEIVTTRFRASTASVFPGFQPETVGVMTGL